MGREGKAWEERKDVGSAWEGKERSEKERKGLRREGKERKEYMGRDEGEVEE